MKTLVLGDIHGRPVWKDILTNNEWDRCIFLGDYFDPYNLYTRDQLLENFNEILYFQRQNPDKVFLLIGNHDYQYLDVRDHGRYSRFDPEISETIGPLLSDLISAGTLKFAYQDGDIVCTHAGVTETWYKNCLQGKNIDLTQVAKQINGLDLEQFAFSSCPWDCYGTSKDNGCLWIRDESLEEYALPGIRQVVGHTQSSKVKHTEDGSLWWIDDLGWEKECIVIEDGTIKTVSWQK